MICVLPHGALSIRQLSAEKKNTAVLRSFRFIPMRFYNRVPVLWANLVTIIDIFI